MNTKDLTFTTTLLIFFVVLIALAIKLYKTPSIVSFDMQKSVKEFSQDLSQKKLNESQKQQLTKAFSADLVNVTESYARENNVIILVSPAIVAGAPDVTDEIQSSIYHELNTEDLNT